MQEISSTNGNDLSDETLSNALIFKRLQMIYLIGYALSAAGNSFQGSYRYAVFDSYKLNRSTTESIYLSAHISTLFIGTLTSSLADKYGRRSACVLSGLFYIISCSTLHFNILWILFLGGVTRGLGHSLYNTNFEAWLIQDHHSNCLSTESLKHILRNAFLLASITAIATGIVSQYSVQLLGFIAPFDIAIFTYILMIIFILWMWSENYGDKEAKVTTSFISALCVLRNDPCILIIGLITALFEATFYIFLIEWTPTLEQAKLLTISSPLPLGWIFSSLMFCNMIGTVAFGFLSNRFPAQSYMIAIFLMAAVALFIPVVTPNIQPMILFSFCLFEFCVGVYQPSMSLLRSQYLPDTVRATLMNYFRVPRLLLMFAIMIWHFPLYIIYIYCVVMLIIAVFCLIMLRKMKSLEGQMHASESMVLLSQTPSFNLKIKRPQIRPNSSSKAIDDED